MLNSNNLLRTFKVEYFHVKQFCNIITNT